MNQNTITEIENLLDLSDDQLYALFGEEVSPRGFGLFSPIDKIKAAKKWIEKHKLELQERLCTDQSTFRKFNDSDWNNRTMTIATVADIIISLAGFPALNVLAVIVLKEGYSGFCKNYVIVK